MTDNQLIDRMAIAPDALLARGYKEYPPNPVIDKCARVFQRAVRSNGMRLYSINIRQWIWEDRISWDCQICTESDTDGYLWATIKEDSIEGMEYRAEAMWKAAGAKPYDAE